jgi:Na+/melibiose symporter-like transporter
MSIQPAMNIQTGKLSFVEKVGYGLGDTASNLYFQMFVIFLLFFYTDIFGISAAASRHHADGVKILGCCQ